MEIRHWRTGALILAGLALTVPAVAQDTSPLHLNQFVRNGSAIRTSLTARTAKSARVRSTRAVKAATKTPLGEFGPATAVETNGLAPAERPLNAPATANGVKVVSPDEVNEIDLAADTSTAQVVVASNDPKSSDRMTNASDAPLGKTTETRLQNQKSADNSWMIPLGVMLCGALAAAGTARFFLARASGGGGQPAWRVASNHGQVPGASV
jgi:hypothetical protein